MSMSSRDSGEPERKNEKGLAYLLSFLPTVKLAQTWETPELLPHPDLTALMHTGCR